MDDLVTLAIEHGELPTLLRVAAAGGAHGRMALRQFCSRAKDATVGRLLGAANFAQPASTCGTSEAGEGEPLLKASPLQLLQYLHRAHLLLHHPDQAGRTLCVSLEPLESEDLKPPKGCSALGWFQKLTTRRRLEGGPLCIFFASVLKRLGVESSA